MEYGHGRRGKKGTGAPGPWSPKSTVEVGHKENGVITRGSPAFGGEVEDGHGKTQQITN
jgi:hypothetical protein